ncbi:phosphatidylethanolamine-binding protein 4 [Protopterus annectens]|uniref:phosphatidylethanolamine-binding protein 4 n=1 Tax=Protopterus annectens TaxID=7888 RepID=UPI001CFC380B|nr:phosphatidylethanolamine-binding protein 4 [Protopterus annectens]
MQHFIKNIRFVRMMQLTLLLLILGVGSGFVEVVETKLEACFYEFLDAPDNKLCRGGLKVIYPEIGDVSCSFIPRCVDYRFRISQEWEAPHVQYPLADENCSVRNVVTTQQGITCVSGNTVKSRILLC